MTVTSTPLFEHCLFRTRGGVVGVSAAVQLFAVIKTGGGSGLSDAGGVSCDPRRVTTEIFSLVLILSVLVSLGAEGSWDRVPPPVQLVASRSEHRWEWYPPASLRLRSPARGETVDVVMCPDVVELESMAMVGCAGAGSCWIRLASRPLTPA